MKINEWFDHKQSVLVASLLVLLSIFSTIFIGFRGRIFFQTDLVAEWQRISNLTASLSARQLPLFNLAASFPRGTATSIFIPALPMLPLIILRLIIKC